ncbi:asparagine synthase-related protein [Micromonospora sp. CPCC 206060]|uniref:asparagine synthase-related protein n=1 Tax=Micromonospora sp. CPCC 206060 TaxID=3122406 RepID=UPI002FF0F8D0
MTDLAGYVDLHPDRQPARRLRDLAGTDGPGVVSGDGWAVAAVSRRSPLPGDDAPLPVRDGPTTRGLVLGRLFGVGGRLSQRRTAPVPLDWLDADGAIGRRTWGRYVAAAVRPDGTLLLARDPIGLLPCFHARHSGGLVFATRMELLTDLLGDLPGVDFDRLGSFLTQGPCPTTRTAFQGVSQLPPGTILTRRGAQQGLRPLWSAARVAVTADGGLPSDEELRYTLRACTQAWIADAPRATLDLSGGLDSSAVCWAARPDRDSPQGFTPRFVRFGTGPSVDEQPLAALVADRLGTGLDVIEADTLLPLTPPHGPLPRADAPQLQFTEARLNEFLAGQAGQETEALSGGGGDQVFLMKNAPGYLADHVRGRNLLPALAQAWRESRHGLESLPSMLTGARRELRRRQHHEPALTGADFDFPQPAWLHLDAKTPVDLPPDATTLPAARANQILGITYWGDAVDRQHRNPHRPSIYPLLSQPLVEIALRAPVRRLLDHTGDRLPLRRAMRGRLPAEAADAPIKGSYAGMYQRALRHNVAVARELITDGRCAAQGLIDPTRALDDLRATARGLVRGPNWPLYSLLAVELWCRAWQAPATPATGWSPLAVAEGEETR